MHNIKELMNSYVILKQYEDEVKVKKDILKERIAEYMHKKKTTTFDIEVGDNPENWNCNFQTRETKSVDYDLLLNVVGKDEFDKIVTTNKNTSLVIRKKKQPKTSKTNTIPTVPISS